MRISLKWLRELVPLAPEVTVQQIADKLTLSGLEVEGIEDLGESLKGVKIGLIKAREPHPNADRLSVCEVTDGNETFTIVCGAPNCDADQFVALAPVGTTLTNGLTIAETKIRGQKSSGMLCSEKELGLSAAHDGIMTLDPSYADKLGEPLGTALELNDAVIEIGVTPNRPDALSHIGVAREVAAVFGVRPRFQVPSCAERGGPVDAAARVDIHDAEACPRYSCRVIENVTVGPSPQWMVARLAACGIRSVNNLVDVTNLVMMERGIPLHAFDWGTLAKENDRDRANVIVRSAESGEKLKTIDGKELELSSDDLVIADRKGPIALAGVMGGEPTQVTETTKKILLECAYFEPSGVRRSARRFAIHSESSHRFERGCDPNGVKATIDRAAQLIAELGDGIVCRDVIDVYPNRIEPVHVSLRPERAAMIMGLPETDLSEARCSQLLQPLGLEVAGRDGEALRFRVPTYRPDLTREIDLIEELLRIIGYDTVTPTLPSRRGETTGLVHRSRQKVIHAARQALLSAGMHEAVNLAFASPTDFERYALDGNRTEKDAGFFSQSVSIQNPLGEEMSWLRFSLLPGLVQNAALNQRRRMDNVSLFETGTVFLGENPLGKHPMPSSALSAAGGDSWALEELRVAGIIAGSVGVSTFDRNAHDTDFFDGKGVIEELLVRLGIEVGIHSTSVKWEPISGGFPFLHPGAKAQVWLEDSSGERANVGFLGELHPDLMEELDMRGNAVVFEISVNRLADLLPGRPKCQSLPKFPAVKRDFALVLDESVPTADLCAGISSDASVADILEELEVFDVYQGEHIPKGKKSVALSLTLRAEHRTLTDKEIMKVESKLLASAQKNFGAEIRS